MKTQRATQTTGVKLPAQQRDRSALDLLTRIPAVSPRRVANLREGLDDTEDLLAQQFPDADILSIAYASFAAAAPDHDRYRYRPFHVSGVRPSEPFDLIFSNGALEMLPSLRQLAPELLSLIRPGGWLAFQLPNNLREPNRQIQRMIAVDGPWADKLKPVAKSRHFNETVEDLDIILGSLCTSIEFWETTYILRLNGVAGIIESMRETSLAPFLEPLDETLRRQFLARFAAELAEAYPPQPDGKILLRFPRIFFLAQK